MNHSAEDNAAENGPSDIEDAELVARCQNGDTSAFNILVTRYRGKVYAMIMNMVHNDADAWDLAQDAFVKAWKSLPKFESRSSFYTWLFRITHNVTYDWLRKKRIRGDSEFDDTIATSGSAEPGAPTAPKEQPTPDGEIARYELRMRIENAIGNLSDDHRAVILLKEVDGLKYEEIAAAVNCTLGTVMSRLFYARKKLQDLLRDSYETIR